MKLHHTTTTHLNQFTGYGDGYVMVNQERFEGSLIVTPTEVHSWRPTDFSTLEEADFAMLLEFGPELVLLGTGDRIRFPHPRLSRALASAHVGLDTMDTGALCRTFNVLTAEERRVVALVLGA
ncbi:Mth938-like domain-containing protein [Chitiniphilus purpureus]|uniref:Mth938-like domain-containing protein n=1 Tax=Chitiniphilus purpureus TaxID=2981137 RepID=A0ABY6DQZ3_9NEIS|nr:Mth938-like domain-containing protein [Chitiniphilus sp. CD1]UXY16800.1 Mth938-like domain-containing protein [Chitiniphilus sp. CD1]